MFATKLTGAASVPTTFSELTALLEGVAIAEALWSLAVPTAVVIAGLLLGNLAARLIERWVSRTETKLDDLVPAHVLSPLRLLIPVTLLRMTMPLYELPPALRAWLQQALLLALILAVGWLAIRSLRAVAEIVGIRLDIEQSDNLQARAVQTQVTALRGVASFLVGVLTFAFALMTFDQVRQLVCQKPHRSMGPTLPRARGAGCVRPA